MAADINKVVLVGRLTRDAEQSYTQSGFALLKFSIAVNRNRKQGDQWVEEVSFFDVTVFGRQGEAIANYMTKGKQVAVEGQLRQDRWEAQDGSKRSKVTIDANNIQLLGGRDGGSSGGGQGGGFQSDGGWNNQGSSAPQKPAPPRQDPPPTNFEDDIPF
ncbi:MAG: single-stranded DNA-binding protein [Spirochaetaceae bacterium]|nr:single-stranded DNA-binding protein [Spirochaetaceae bacterium]